jgi:hypothetical protein
MIYAIYIKMEKILEKNNIAYYHVSTEDLGGSKFYVGIDKQEKKIYCYFERDFSNIIRIIDCNDPNERIGNLPRVDSLIISKVIGQAFKVFKSGEFSQYLDYCA